jgi:hypothetical protein
MERAGWAVGFVRLLAAYIKLLAARKSRCADFCESHLGFHIGDMSPMWAQYCVHLVSLIAKVDAMLDQCDFHVPNAGE